LRYLVTGAAGFIGSFVARSLLDRGDEVIGLDNLTPYYEVALKEARLDGLRSETAFTELRLDLADRDGVAQAFARYRPEPVIPLAAQAGVRYSLENPHAYADSNLEGLLNVLEGCRHQEVAHLVLASSSSVYGANTRLPFSVHDTVDHPVSLYAATKKAGELMAHTYSHLYGLPVTGLRFFTVYGPWGRPDMAYFRFARAIVAGEPIEVYNHGRMQRDFTYIDDAVEAVVRVADRLPEPDPAWSGGDPDPATSYVPYRLYNVGNHSPVGLMEFIGILEGVLGRAAEKRPVAMQPGDVAATHADVADLQRDVGFAPDTPLQDGLARFGDWFRWYYRL